MSKAIRILVDDGMQIKVGTGIGNYSKQLFNALGSIDGVSVDLVNYSPKEKDRKLARLSYLRFLNSHSYRSMAEEYDLCIFTNYAMPFRPLHTRTAVTVHDLACFDCPQTLPRAYVPYLRVMIGNSVKKADRIITVSQSIEDAIRLRWPSHADKVSFAWPGLLDQFAYGGPNASYTDEALGSSASEPFFLMVGTVEKRKNVEFVISAFARHLNGSFGAKNGRKLIIAGRPGFGFDEIREHAIDCGVENSVVFPGYVSDGDLRNLYRDALAVVFPSVYEGFGFIQIECMAMGKPILLSDIPTNREVSDGYGLFFGLADPSELSEAMGGVAPLDARQRAVAEAVLAEADWPKVAALYVADLVAIDVGSGDRLEAEARSVPYHETGRDQRVVSQTDTNRRPEDCGRNG